MQTPTDTHSTPPSVDAGVPTPDRIRQAPKVLLHDHLDGGLRPQTIIELAEGVRYQNLPSTNPDKLAEAMTEGANRKDLTLYLETFDHTVAVMQTADSIARVARECAEDLNADGVVYAEVRFAPELHTTQGLTLDDVIEAAQTGFAVGTDGTNLTIRTICSAMRHADNALPVAEAAVRWRDRGVVGFDIAGPEDGYPPDMHIEAFHFCRRENFHITIHAGEAYGPRSIWKAVQYCGAERLGHGIRIVEDINSNNGELVLGKLAHYLRDRRIPLEICPTSNLHTGLTDDMGDHPISELIDLRFRVTVNTDNRLMSNVTLTSELAALVDAFGYGWDQLRWLTINAMKSSFLPFTERLAIIENIIKPGYDTLAQNTTQQR